MSITGKRFKILAHETEYGAEALEKPIITKAYTARAKWADKVLADLLQQGVPKEEIEVREFAFDPLRTEIWARGEPVSVFNFRLVTTKES
jgi:hypothetical protein